MALTTPGGLDAIRAVRAEAPPGSLIGAGTVKIFPASQRGPRRLGDLRAALPQAPLVPTGGVTPATAPEWVAAGAVACGMGSSLSSGGPRAAAERVTALVAVLTGGAKRSAP
jgi:2-dehydro-3-deoxyphosphogluconate aldolase/(4S)-4-hydroxy-2-oxoglutarate aldolase